MSCNITLGINSAVTTLLLGYGYTKLTLLPNVAQVFVYRVPVIARIRRLIRDEESNP